MFFLFFYLLESRGAKLFQVSKASDQNDQAIQQKKNNKTQPLGKLENITSQVVKVLGE